MCLINNYHFGTKTLQILALTKTMVKALESKAPQYREMMVDLICGTRFPNWKFETRNM